MTQRTTKSPLGLDEDLLVACVSCGLCLPHCPTYRATGEEAASPRGRISLMRAVESGALEPDAHFTDLMDRCVMCRGCETACPSGVQFGALMEGTRIALHERGRRTPFALSLGLRVLQHHRLLLLGSSALGIAQRTRLLPGRLSRRLGLPDRIPVRQAPLRADAGPVDVWLHTGCVMDAWQRDVHAAAARLLRSSGHAVGLPGTGGACCGALHAHAGLHDDAARAAARTMASMPGDAPILVDSAGCGAQLKDYGRLLGTPEAEAFSARVRDIAEHLATVTDQLPSAQGRRFPGVVAVQDPCHLRHVQRAHLPVRALLRPYADLVELDDDGRCCGAGGSYSLQQPELAGEIRSQKVAAVRRTSATHVASANPGCSVWLAAAGLTVLHPVQIVDAVVHPTGRTGAAR